VIYLTTRRDRRTVDWRRLSPDFRVVAYRLRVSGVTFALRFEQREGFMLWIATRRR